MELALLSAVVGREGGPLPGAPGGPWIAALLETDRGRLPIGGGPDGGVPPADVDGLSAAMGIGGGPDGGGPAALAVRVGGAEDFGGGGVARTGALLFGSFLLTHFFSSLS